MNSPTFPHLNDGAPDALFDRIEGALLALTTARLDGADGASADVVDERADDVSGHWRMPPGRRAGHAGAAGPRAVPPDRT